MNEAQRYAATGKTLRINLTSGETWIEDTYDEFRTWLSGYGYSAKVLFEELPKWVTPYDPRNRVIIYSGVLIGTFAPGAAKVGISTLGPVTGGWANGQADSHFAVDLKECGFDNVILEGISRRPCYLYLTDNNVEIRDATDMWGMTTKETLQAVRDAIGDPQAHVLSIGPAGENLVRAACVIQDEARAVGRGGMGAVLGSKRVKAIVARGTKPIRVADSKKFLEAIKDIDARIGRSPVKKIWMGYGPTGTFVHKQKIGIPFKNFQHCQLDEDLVDEINSITLQDKYGTHKIGYPGCRMPCGKMMHITDGKYAGTKAPMNQLEIIGTFMGRLAVRTGAFQVVVNAKCNAMGIDVDAAGGPIGWAMECFERGILTTKETDGMELEWGNEEQILTLIEKMSKREGFGNILAEGAAGAADIIGRGSERYAMHTKRMDLYELCRSSNGWGLGVTVSTRGGGHVTSSPAYEQLAVPPEDTACLRELGMSGHDAWDPHDYERKHILVGYSEIITRLCNNTGICVFHSSWGDPDLINVSDIAKMVTAATGEEFTADDMRRIATRQLNMEKAINAKFTAFTKKDDYPPERELEEPVSRGIFKGWKLDRDKWTEMLERYYRMHKWDTDTSYPTRESLSELSLDSVADELEKMGRLGKVSKAS
ncbi:MAG: hypothetical protein HS112_13390 [Zoogloeaceae bacterium]|nr:hypothetical protein [Zoogloeaceae bacterium]